MQAQLLQFPGGSTSRPTPTRAELEESAAQWFDQALTAMFLAAELMGEGKLEEAKIQLAHNVRCSARACAYIEQADALSEVSS